jgi:hypothetical protein
MGFYTSSWQVAFLLTFVFGQLLALPSAAQAQQKSPQKQERAFAILEYFTSEACIRCRETSVLAEQVVKNSGGVLKRVYLLAFHVDSLNSIEWKDPYSSGEYTKRQLEYAQKFKLASAPPGTFVLNGKKYLDSASPIVMQRAVLDALKQRSLATIDLAAKSLPENGASVAYRVRGLHKTRQPFFLLHVAAIQPKISRTVNEGVNSGVNFDHVNVVRSFQTVRIEPEDKPEVLGRVELVLPEELEAAEAHYIAFVQDPRTFAVVGAEQVGLLRAQKD